MVHPHLRGAYAALPRQQLIFPGSSPHTWGIPVKRGRITPSPRFIPTYVGHTPPTGVLCTILPVHPHIRGAYEISEETEYSKSGSSPHTWGILQLTASVFGVSRFIPTYVGHTSDLELFHSDFPVHPHIRGAYVHLGPVNTLLHPVHPHIRGAYSGADFLGQTNGGSSPHTWGIQICAGTARMMARFIPTYVGHTSMGTLAALRGSVHPHIRGAYVCIFTTFVVLLGSSPHTWGIRCLP